MTASQVTVDLRNLVDRGTQNLVKPSKRLSTQIAWKIDKLSGYVADALDQLERINSFETQGMVHENDIERTVDVNSVNAIIELYMLFHTFSEHKQIRRVLHTETLEMFKEQFVPGFISQHLKELHKMDSPEKLSHLNIKLFQTKLNRRNMREMRKSLNSLQDVYKIVQLQPMSQRMIDAFINENVISVFRSGGRANDSELSKLKEYHRVPAKQPFA